MREKMFTQFFLLLAAFFGLWFLLSRIDFVNEDEVKAFAREKEKRLGELILETITTTNEKVENEEISAVLDSIKARICRTKKIACDSIKLHLVRNSEVNAFALPDNHLVIYTGLLEYCENAEEVAGVMAHEIGHLEHNHVMKKLAKEIGMEMLFAIAGGDAGFEISRQTAKLLSSTAFDRRHEREADAFAVECLSNADVDPQFLSNFFFRLSRKHDLPDGLSWISTHPESSERAAEIIALKKKFSYDSIPLLRMPWQTVKDKVHDAQRNKTESEENTTESEE